MRVRDVIEDSRFHPRVMGALHRIDDLIRWVHITDLADPSEYLRGGELILTSALWYQGPDDAESFVGSLAAKHVYALGVALYNENLIPEGLVEACVRHDVILLVLPDVAFMDITEGVLTRLMNERRGESLHLIRLEQGLISQLPGGGGGAALVEALESELGVRCWILQRNGRVIHSGQQPPADVVQLAWRTGFGFRRRMGTRELPVSGAKRMTCVGVNAGSARLGEPPVALIVYEATAAQVSANETTAVGVPVWYLPIAIEFERLEHQATRTIAAELFSRIDKGGVGFDDLTPLLDAIAIEYTADLAIVTVSIVDANPILAADAVEAAARFVGLGRGVVIFTTDRHVGIFEQGSFVAPKRFGDDLAAALSEMLSTAVAVGTSTGQAHTIRELMMQSLFACAVAGTHPTLAASAAAADVGSHRLLLALASDALRGALHSSLLEPLIRHDSERGSELMRTLEVFLDTACSWTRAAHRLHIHVNTLRYRVRQVEELTLRDLSTMPARVDMFLALQSYVTHTFATEIRRASRSEIVK